jgi:hypothetical protein
MNYEKNYYDYISYVKTLNRSKKDDIYYEGHHIIPKSLGGEGDARSWNHPNIIHLTAREHYLAHYLLWKFTEKKELMFAFYSMSNKNKTRISSKMYEKLRKEFSVYISENNSGKIHIISEETKEKISISHKGKKASEKTKEILREKHANVKGEKNPFFNKHHTKETRKKISDKLSGKNHPRYGKFGSDNPASKKVINIESCIIFDSIKQASEWCNLKSSSNIIEQINGKKKYAGKHPETNKCLHWKYI